MRFGFPSPTSARRPASKRRGSSFDEPLPSLWLSKLLASDQLLDDRQQEGVAGIVRTVGDGRHADLLLRSRRGAAGVDAVALNRDERILLERDVTVTVEHVLTVAVMVGAVTATDLTRAAARGDRAVGLSRRASTGGVGTRIDVGRHCVVSRDRGVQLPARSNRRVIRIRIFVAVAQVLRDTGRVIPVRPVQRRIGATAEVPLLSIAAGAGEDFRGDVLRTEEQEQAGG